MIPLSFAQRRLWFLAPARRAVRHLQHPVGAAAGRGRWTWRRCGRGADGRRRPARERCARVFAEDADGDPDQLILPPEAGLPVPVVDVAADAVDAALDERGVAARLRPGDRTPAAGHRLFAARPARSTSWSLVFHHIAADGWSMAPLARDLVAAYAARPTGQRARSGRRCRCSTRTTRCGSASCSATRTTRTAWPRQQLALLARRRWPALPRADRAAARPAAPGVASHRGGHGRFAAGRPDVLHRARRAGPRARRQPVHGGAGRAGRAADPARRRHRRPDRHAHRRPHRRGPGRPGRVLRQHAGAAHRHCPATRRSATCWPGSARPTSPRTPTRTCRSSGWWRCSTRAARMAHHPLFQVMLACQNNARPATRRCPG